MGGGGGGGRWRSNEQLEVSLREKVQEAANASLDRLFSEFKIADDSRWNKVIERARKGAEHPLEALNHSNNTEDHPVCSAILSFIGSTKKGKEVRAHFSDPPYGWPRDAVDGALISLFSVGHLRAITNGTHLKTAQLLDQVKIPRTNFRVEATTINARQRMRIRKLFTEAEVFCKPKEELDMAGKFLDKLNNLACNAGGDAPLPERPDTKHLSHLQSLTDNEQLIGILERHDELLQNFKDWTSACELGKTRMQDYNRLQSLMYHADGLDTAKRVQPQIDAIVSNRSLLDITDPIQNLTKALVDTLRKALGDAEKQYTDVFKQESACIESAESWQKIGQSDRRRILNDLKITKDNKGTTGTEQDVLESLERISLNEWRTRTAALPKLFEDARIQADKLVEPKIRQVRIHATTLHTPKEVRDWITRTEQEILKQLKQGPVAVS